MFFKQEETRIGGYTYKVTQLDAISGVETLARLWNTLGPSLGAIDQIDEAAVMKGLGGLATSLKADDVKFFITKFARLTAVSGGDLKEGAEPQLSDIFEAHFAGRYLDLFKWLRFCFEVNYRSFFGVGGELVALVRKLQEESESKSPTVSKTGRDSSGGSS